MTVQPVDSLVALLARAESAPAAPVARAEAPRIASPNLPARQPRPTPAAATTAAGLQLPTAAGGIAASRRLQALRDIALATQRDMGEAYQAVAGHFEAEIADAQAQLESTTA